MVELVYRRVVSKEVPTGLVTATSQEAGGRETIPNGCHHQNDSCMKMGSDESHFNVLMKRETIANVAQTPTLRVYGNSGIKPDGQR